MLSPADAAIVARDAALPGLRLALDAEALSAALGLPSMTPLYLRYKPGTSCVASLAPEDGRGMAAVAVMAYTSVRYAEVRRRSEWRDGPNPAIFHDAACLALVPLARERALKGARRIVDPERGDAFLRELAGDDAADYPRLLRYKAGRRLVLSTGGGARRTLVKAYTKHDFAAAQEGARIGAALDGVPILGVSARRQCLAWRWLEGTPLDVETRRIAESAGWQAAGRALARVHRSPMRPTATLGRAEEAAELAAVTTALTALAPDLARMAAPVVARAAESLARTAFTETLIHGDFSADQVLIDKEGHATIIDWDRAAKGDPARDVGVFLAWLDAQMLDGALAISGPAEAFVDGYAGAGGPAQAPATSVQHARALLALVTEGFRQRRPDWPQRARRLIARAEAVLETGRVRRGPSPVDPAMPALDDALETRVMAPLLEKTLSRDVRHVEAELVRHKPGRRALIRYRIDVAEDEKPLILLGKLRAKGADVRTPALHVALQAQGLDGRAPDCVGVPAAHGCIAAPALWLQEEMPGRSLDTLLYPGADRQPAARTGAALARLHAAAVPADRQWSMADELRVLERALDSARTRLPTRTTQLDAIANVAARLVQLMEPTTTTPIHRDFYPEQVLFDGGRIWLLDLDLYADGDPAIDVSNFLAHVDELGLRRHGNATALADHAEAFVEAYDGIRPGVDPRRVEHLRLVALARHIHLSQVIPGRSHTTSALIDHCIAAFLAIEDDDRAAALA